MTRNQMKYTAILTASMLVLTMVAREVKADSISFYDDIVYHFSGPYDSVQFKIDYEFTDGEGSGSITADVWSDFEESWIEFDDVSVSGEGTVQFTFVASGTASNPTQGAPIGHSDGEEGYQVRIRFFDDNNYEIDSTEEIIYH